MTNYETIDDIVPEQPTVNNQPRVENGIKNCILDEAEKLELLKKYNIIHAPVPPWHYKVKTCLNHGPAIRRNSIYLTKEYVRIEKVAPNIRCCCKGWNYDKEVSDVLLSDITSVSNYDEGCNKQFIQLNLMIFPGSCCGCHRIIVGDLCFFLWLIALLFLISLYIAGNTVFSIAIIAYSIALIIDLISLYFELRTHSVHFGVSGSYKDFFLVNMGSENTTNNIKNWVFLFKGIFRERFKFNTAIIDPYASNDEGKVAVNAVEENV